MESRVHLAKSIVGFLKTEVQNGSLDVEAVEGLEVAIQCIETAYGFDGEQQSQVDLLQLFTSSPLTKTNNSRPSFDKENGEKWKAEGNKQMKIGKFDEAIASYSKAIECDPSNAVYFCNRAAAWTKMNENFKAVNDCEQAIKMDPNYSKAYGRLGLVNLAEKNYAKAVENYEKAVSLEPTNAAYQSNLEVAKEKLKGLKPSPANATPNAANPLAGMDIGALLNNPAVMSMAQSFMQNPQMQSMFSNMMGGAQPPPPTQQPPPYTSTPSAEANPAAGGTNAPPPTGGMQFPPGLDFNNIMQATSSFADQLRQQNPQMVENLYSQFQQGVQEQQQQQQPNFPSDPNNDQSGNK